jgi:GNAT superfamily N-acetyltransferase
LADLSHVVQCNLSLALDTEHRQLNRPTVEAGVRALLGDPAKGIYFIAEAGGVFAGQLMTTYEWSDWRNGNFWWIQSVYVLQQFRRQGVFRALFKHVHALAKADPGICGIRLYMEANNESARRTYGSLGLKQTPYEVYEIDFVLNHNE